MGLQTCVRCVRCGRSRCFSRAWPESGLRSETASCGRGALLRPVQLAPIHVVEAQSESPEYLRHLRHSVTNPYRSRTCRRHRRFHLRRGAPHLQSQRREAPGRSLSTHHRDALRRSMSELLQRQAQPHPCACPILLDAALSPAIAHCRTPPTLAGFFAPSRQRSLERP